MALKPAEQKLALRKFTRQQWAIDPTVDKQGVLALATGSIPDALKGRTRDSNLQLIYGELTRAKLGRPFKFTRKRPSKVTPQLRARIEALYNANPFGVSYRGIANQMQSEGTQIGKDVVGKVVRDLRRLDSEAMVPSPSPPGPLRDGYNWTPSPQLGPRELRAIEQWFAIPPQLPSPPAPFELEHLSYPIRLPVREVVVQTDVETIWVPGGKSPDYRPEKCMPPKRSPGGPSEYHESDFEEVSNPLEPLRLESDAPQRLAVRQAEAKKTEKAAAAARRAEVAAEAAAKKAERGVPAISPPPNCCPK